MLRFLMDERGFWFVIFFFNNIVNYWKFDRIEDFWRCRLKLRRNYYFDERLCYLFFIFIVIENEIINVINESKFGVIYLFE